MAKVRAAGWDSGDLGSILCSATGFLCDPGHITSPVCASGPYLRHGDKRKVFGEERCT